MYLRCTFGMSFQIADSNIQLFVYCSTSVSSELLSLWRIIPWFMSPRLKLKWAFSDICEWENWISLVILMASWSSFSLHQARRPNKRFLVAYASSVWWSVHDIRWQEFLNYSRLHTIHHPSRASCHAVKHLSADEWSTDNHKRVSGLLPAFSFFNRSKPVKITFQFWSVGWPTLPQKWTGMNESIFRS